MEDKNAIKKIDIQTNFMRKFLHLSTMCIQVVTRKAPPVQVFERLPPCKFSTHRYKLSWKTHIHEKLPDMVPDRDV